MAFMLVPTAFRRWFDAYKTAYESLLKTPTEEKYDQHKDLIYDLESNIPEGTDEDELTLPPEHVREVVDFILAQVVKNKGWPHFKRESYDTKILVDMAECVMDECRRHDLTDLANELGIKILKTCLRAGPTLGHTMIMDRVYRDASLSDVWEEADLEIVREIFDILVQTNPSPRHKDEDEDFCDGVRSVVTRDILNDIRPDKYMAVKESAAELLITSIEKMHTENEPVCTLHASIMTEVHDKCFNDDVRLYDLFPDIEVLQDHIKRLQTVILREDFYFHDEMYYAVRKMIDRFTKAIHYGLTDDNKNQAMVALNRLFSEVNKHGTDKAKTCISRPEEDAMKKLGDQLALVAAGGDAFVALTEAIRALQTDDDERTFRKKYEKMFDTHIMTNLTQDNMEKIVEFVVASLEVGFDAPIKMSITIVERRKLINFKDSPEIGHKFMAVLKDVHVTNRNERSTDHYDFYRKLNKILKSQKVSQEYEDDRKEIIFEALKHHESPLHHYAAQPMDEMRWDKNIEDAIKVFDMIYELITEKHDIYKGDPLYQLCYQSVLFITMVINETPKDSAVAPSLAKIFHYCKDQDFDHPSDPDKKTLYWELLTSIMQDYLMRNDDKKAIIETMIEDVKELSDCGDEMVERDANNLMQMIAGKHASLLGDQIDTLLDKYFNENENQLIAQFTEMYKVYPDVFHPKLDEFADKMTDGCDEWVSNCTVGFFFEVVKNKPDALSQHAVDIIASRLETDQRYIVVMILLAIADRDPNMVDKHVPLIMEAMKQDKRFVPHASGLFVPLVNISEDKAVEYVQFLVDIGKTVDSQSRISVLYNLKVIAGTHREIVARHKDVVVNELKEPSITDHVQYLIDAIEGRTLASIDREVHQHGEEIENLDEKVMVVAGGVETLKEDVKTNTKDINHIKEDVTKAEERLDQVEDKVEETVERVEELEHRTLSHAPEWSRDVSKLLNPEAEHDWRLLSQRLGYSNDDIRNWATQPDPCMSMLDEWFATNKTREATHAVLKNLKEMNRTDAANIVQRALKAVEDIIADQPEDYSNPPPVFISYQWGHQQEVKLLKRHLQSAGFDGWIDIGQMGGGDKLYEKIDQGVRAAKVVICCVSEKYAESPNCNREVNLCTMLGKPIIPLLMEKMAWPPPGSMGPIFGEFLFIRFFQRPGEETEDNRYWPAAKFQELLMQLRYNVIPDPEIMTDEYKGWWDPPEEDIIIKQRKEKKTEESKSRATETADPPSPSVFISYQWGKQPQIKALYRRLTQLGYHCWLDIMQMGGGDSLYDKIDKGVRGCKMVLSCVTTKYALSANCRREVSLADALKKPIVPLLLERMAWPPEGPMSMPFTQLLYINFCKPDAEIQNHWECPQFEELLQKIREQVPILDFDVVDDEDGDQQTTHTRDSESDGNDYVKAVAVAHAAGNDDKTEKDVNYKAQDDQNENESGLSYVHNESQTKDAETKDELYQSMMQEIMEQDDDVTKENRSNDRADTVTKEKRSNDRADTVTKENRSNDRADTVTKENRSNDRADTGPDSQKHGEETIPPDTNVDPIGPASTERQTEQDTGKENGRPPSSDKVRPVSAKTRPTTPPGSANQQASVVDAAKSSCCSLQ